MKIIKAGTRKSLLALVQTQIIIDKIRKKFPEISVDIVPISTKGDEHLNRTLDSFGGKGVFTKELDEQLLDGSIDIAVHSAKDMPTHLPHGLMIGAVGKRECFGDVLAVCRDRFPHLSQGDIPSLPEGFVAGTGSLRRSLALSKLNPGIRPAPIRGNVQTRLMKLKSGAYDGIILAQAGIRRLLDNQAKVDGAGIADDFDYSPFSFIPIDIRDMLPAAGQGLLAVECRCGDEEILEILSAVNDTESALSLEAERGFLQAIGGGCNAPAAAFTKVWQGQIFMDAMYAANGQNMEKIWGSAPVDQAKELGQDMARRLVRKDIPSPGRVFLIGAGPGDEGLMSVKGLARLGEADVIVYDHLASPGFLNEARDDARLVYAGKVAGSHYLKQDEISCLLVRYAREGKTVARLKGGDVFVFGRGSEEGEALCEAGIEFEVIPGISSAYAVPAYAGIPVTHRGLASAFHVITGHEDETKCRLSLDYNILAKEEGTLVFLMGLKNLEDIARRLVEGGKDPATPAAVIQSGTTSRQKVALAPLASIWEEAQKQGIKTPAITVVGPVADLEKTLSWYGKGPMWGKNVLLTGSRSMTRLMAKAFENEGAQPIPFSLIRTVPSEGVEIDSVYETLERWTWAVFTSRNGVETFFEGMKERQVDVRRLAGLKFAAIGQGTARALLEYGIVCDYVPQVFTSEAMSKDWVPLLCPGDRVLLLRARQASKVLEDALEAAGISYKAAALYEICPDWRKAGELNRLLDETDYITLCSASAARALCQMAGAKRVNDCPARVVCIGPVTCRQAIEEGLAVDLTAQTYDTQGMIRAILKDLQK
ncbi:uroporphyrinogen III methyltransferase/synthase [Catenibacillus scindens]|uniref:Porphobilinogen deaminase n=1 Tax=Catenibacillus scindens TaxID=673271 RepID=A0A7W8HCM3_9FIRM|nr:uroporphyrinogen-III C-methyltransferase [Catenibacillus scindens]MBB5265937.1 uroporphyrinogen III methyltransferase/synthase [Catenibacillus scindens]